MDVLALPALNHYQKYCKNTFATIGCIGSVQLFPSVGRDKKYFKRYKIAEISYICILLKVFVAFMNKVRPFFIGALKSKIKVVVSDVAYSRDKLTI